MIIFPNIASIPTELLKCNHVSRSDLVKDVILQQIIPYRLYVPVAVAVVAFCSPHLANPVTVGNKSNLGRNDREPL
jgi:hypothetical protein